MFRVRIISSVCKNGLRVCVFAFRRVHVHVNACVLESMCFSVWPLCVRWCFGCHPQCPTHNKLSIPVHLIINISAHVLVKSWYTAVCECVGTTAGRRG